MRLWHQTKVTTKKEEEEEEYTSPQLKAGDHICRILACVLSSDENISDSSSSTIINIGSIQLQILHTATIPPPNNDSKEEEYTPQQIINEACNFFKMHTYAHGARGVRHIAALRH